MTWQTDSDNAKGWLFPAERDELHRAALTAAGPYVEIGGYCGKSAIALAAAAELNDTVLFSIDWHRGSPEMAANRECHDPDMVGADGLFDSFPHFRRNLQRSALEQFVIPVVGSSPVVGKYWATPIGFLFIDGAHDAIGVRLDYELWSPHIAPGGLLAFHDSNIDDIGQVADRAMREGFEVVAEVDTLRVLRCSP